MLSFFVVGVFILLLLLFVPPLSFLKFLLGFKLENDTFRALGVRYGNKENNLSLASFIHVAIKIRFMYSEFPFNKFIRRWFLKGKGGKPVIPPFPCRGRERRVVIGL